MKKKQDKFSELLDVSLAGLSEAVAGEFPDTMVQTCIVHLDVVWLFETTC